MLIAYEDCICMFREALKTGFYDLHSARDEYMHSCGSGGMNRDLLWQFMDVQTRLITPIRPHYAELYILGRRFLRRMVMPLKQDGPRLMCLILLLKKPHTYLQELIVSIRKQLLKKSNADVSNEKKRPIDGFPNLCGRPI